MNPIAMLADIMLQAVNFFYAFTGNYGLAIILLTVTVNMALYPLTVSSIQQMGAISKIQPKVKEIQEKYKKEPEKQQKEILALYKTEKVNPIGGCLPVLLKLPFFLALFFALQSPEFTKIIAELGTKSAFLWIPNMAKPDHTYILAILIGLTTYLTQITMPGATAQSKAMAYFMPAFIIFISIPFPAGVQIYWVTSNVVALAQQVYINRKQ